MSKTIPNRVLICNTCLRAPDATPLADDIEALRTALQSAGLAALFEVTEVGCFGGCSNPSGIAFQGQGRASYVFSGTELASDLNDVLAFCHAYLAAKDGWIEDARPLGRLRHCLRARIPAF
ncbi:MAG: putative metal-binding protein [Paracoccaceae bacterium]